MIDPTKRVLLSVGDGPDGIELYTSEEDAVVDWARSVPSLYMTASCGMYGFVKFGPFPCSAATRWDSAKRNFCAARLPF